MKVQFRVGQSLISVKDKTQEFGVSASINDIKK